MIIGIDVGGTHADGVLLEGADVIKKNKVNVNQTNLQDGILSLLESLIPDQKDRLSEIHLSTTVCTNAVVKEEFEKEKASSKSFSALRNCPSISAILPE